MFGLSPHYSLQYSKAEGYVGGHVRFFPILRHLLPVVEKRFDVSHVYTHLGDWHFLRVLGARPIVLTATQKSNHSHTELLQKVSHVVVQSERLKRQALSFGIPENRVLLLYPGVDLNTFTPVATLPSGPPWRCIFASSPETPEELVTKGVDLLLDLAERCPDIEIDMLWRPFGKGSEDAYAIVQQRGLRNVIVQPGRVRRIEEAYRKAHFTVAPFRSVGKAMPNSLLEGFACGLPGLISNSVDLSEVVQREGIGVVFEPNVDSIISGFHELVRHYPQYQKRTRDCAVSLFDIRKVFRTYHDLYAAVS